MRLHIFRAQMSRAQMSGYSHNCKSITNCIDHKRNKNFNPLLSHNMCPQVTLSKFHEKRN